MKVSKALLPLILLCSVSFAANAEGAKKELRWMVTIEPPITYLDASGNYKGYGIEILKRIQASLPSYEHTIFVAGNYKRLVQEVQDKQSLSCALGLFKTDERLKILYYAHVPVFYFFNMQIAMRTSMFEEMGKPEQLSLHHMMNQKNYTLGLSDGRTYSSAIREIVDQYKGQSNVRMSSQGNVGESLLNMVSLGRIDYTFVYPEEAIYLSRKHGLENKITTVPIAEAKQLGYSWPVCTKTAEGSQIASQITNALTLMRQEDSYRELYENWLSSNLLKSYRKKYQEEFLKIYE
ncbi:transporter substrate-binding domain-containing protein [Vibrio marisflavi]|nr:transporter substrate-binding domain-containing protein [Vibrio marisflavi]